MTDNKELVTCIEDLRECVGKVDKRMQVLQVQLEPVVKIMQGNGKPGLPVRLHMAEQRMDVVEKTGAWVMRLAVTATVSALGTLLWALLKSN